MKFLKYEFTPTQWAAAKAKIETTDGEGTWNPELVTAVVELGHLCTAKDAEGQCITTSPMYAVDILWAAEPLVDDFAAYVVYPVPCGVHVFAGWESAYSQEYCSIYPDSDYCKAPDSINI
jgi:hypothetical protein